MREMKESGIEYVGFIPKDWSIYKNKYLFNSKKNIVGDDFNQLQLLSLTTKGVIEKDINNNEGKLPESFGTYQLVRENDLVLCLFDLDVSAVFSGISNFSGMISPAYKIVSCKNKLFPKYIDYWFRVVGDDRNYLLYSKSLRNTINADNFKEIPTIVPSLDEQQKIANYLDKKVALIDEVIEKTKKTIEEYKKYKQSLITEVATKGLDKNVKMKHSGIEWIGEIPEDWQTDKLRYLLNLSTGVSVTKAEFVEDGIECINYGDIHSKYKFDYIADRDLLNRVPYAYIKQKKSSIINNGDFIFCDTSEDIEGSGNCLFIRENKGRTVLAGSHTIIGKPIKKVNSVFLGYLLKSRGVKAQIERSVVGIKVYSITQKILNNVIFSLPPIEEQEEIAKFLDYKSKLVEEAKKSKLKLIVELESYKKSLIYEVVTGKKQIH